MYLLVRLQGLLVVAASPVATGDHQLPFYLVGSAEMNHSFRNTTKHVQLGTLNTHEKFLTRITLFVEHL